MTDKVTTSTKLPIISTVLGAFPLLFAGGLSTWFLLLAFSFIITVLVGASGNLTACINGEFRAHYFCNESVSLFVAEKIVILAVYAIFIRNWISFILAEQKINWRQALIPNLRDAKVIGLILGLFACIAVALGSFYLLYVRIPNPDWQIEIVYFAVVSLGFIVPILSLRFFAYIAAAALGHKLVSPKLMWQKTSGNMLPILGGAFLVVITMLYFNINIMQFGNQAGAGANLIQAWIIEFICSFCKLLLIMLFANFCYLLNKNLFERN